MNTDSEAKISRETKQRKIIMEELAKVSSHPTADELYKIVRKRLPSISLGTVYRNLELLTKLGEIQKLDICGAKKRFDGKSLRHYHMRCKKCLKIYDLPMQPFSALEKTLKNIDGYLITNYRLEFSGLCPNCNKSR